jgi:quercetin dioxygenase-like cupin family protein
MSVPLIHEEDVKGLDLPGRNLRWLVTPESLNAKHMSVCLIRVPPGETVHPAHSHPHGEEAIHIIEGSGRVLVEGEVDLVKPGSTVLFPQGAVHMLQNTGATVMKVICFFAPATDLDNYKFYEDVEFPD